MIKISAPDQQIGEIEKNFGQSLKRWYEENRQGITQAAFGKELNIAQSTVNAIFSGNRCPKEKWRRDVADYIGLDYDEMIGLKKINRFPSQALRLYIQNMAHCVSIKM